MSIETTTTGQPLLKRLYDDGGQKALYPESSLFGAIPKNTVFAGDDFRITAILSTITGSNDYDRAHQNQSTSAKRSFNVTRTPSYVLGTISNEAIMASASDDGAMENLLKLHTDMALAEWSRRNGIYLCGNGGGSLAQLSTTVAPSGTTLTLQNPLDAVFFEDRMILQCANDDGLAAGGVHAGRLTVTGVDPVAGTLTTLEAVTTVPDWGTSDYLFRDGDYNNVIAGILRWITTSASPAALFGATRTDYPHKLAGIRYTQGAGGPVENTIVRAASYGQIFGARKMNVAVINSRRHSDLALSLQARSRYEPAKLQAGEQRVNGKAVSQANIFYDGFKIMTAGGPLFVLSDPVWSYDHALLTELDSWELRALGELPHFDKFAGDRYFVDTNTDGKQFRIKSYMNNICFRPNNSVLATL
jgi:hypothetical protein